MTSIVCEQCGNTFERRTAEYNYQKRKHPERKTFCSIRCTTLFYNKASPTGNKNQNPKLAPSPGNKHGQRYPDGMGYYVTRCAKDRRFSSLETQDDRDAFGRHILDLWNKQHNRCAISGVQLTLRDSRGKCDILNPFNVASIDRIDCDKPYECGNVQWVSYAINLARNDLDATTFISCLQQFLNESRALQAHDLS